jgi:hypothetical protein
MTDDRLTVATGSLRALPAAPDHLTAAAGRPRAA